MSRRAGILHPGGRVSKRLRGIGTESGCATLLLKGCIGNYRGSVTFAGTTREVLFDTGSPLSWVEHRGVADDALATFGQDDGASYADGSQVKGIFHYGMFSLVDETGSSSGSSGGQRSRDGGGVEVATAGMLLVPSEQCNAGMTADGFITHMVAGEKCGIIGLSPRLCGSWQYQGLPHPGDLIREILEKMPSKIVCFHIDRKQALSMAYALGPSQVIFGGLYDEESTYTWTAPGELRMDDETGRPEWIVDLEVGFVGTDGTVSELTTRRVLVDTGCTWFETTSDIARVMSKQWRVDVTNHGSKDTRHGALTECAVRVVVNGDTPFDIPATDLFLSLVPVEEKNTVPKAQLEGVDPDVKVGSIFTTARGNTVMVAEATHAADGTELMIIEPLLLNRIRMLPLGDTHDMVLGAALMAGFSSIAFDYEHFRIGFSKNNSAGPLQ